MAPLKRLVLHRLMSYYRLLAEWTAKDAVKTVTSAQIGESLDIDPTQVRKDLGAIGAEGVGRVGFDVCDVCRSIRTALGFDRTYEAVLIGAGHLGGALLAYGGYTPYGLAVVAAFDNDKRKIGRKIGGYTVKPMQSLRPFVKRHEIPVAVLTTPVDVSQELTDRLVAAGIKVIWNFTPTHLSVPSDVMVRDERILRGLAEIAYHLKP